MTTIAYRDGVLAVDSRMTCAGVIGSNQGLVKAVKSGNMMVVGSGAFADAWPLMLWLLELNHETPPLPLQAASRPKLPDDTRVVAFCRAPAPGRLDIFVFEGDGWYQVDDTAFHAWGSGQLGALCAMEMGADAKRAVEVACRFDVYSGGPVQALSLSPCEPESGVRE